MKQRFLFVSLCILMLFSLGTGALASASAEPSAEILTAEEQAWWDAFEVPDFHSTASEEVSGEPSGES